MTYVIAVASPVGGGKTSLVKALQAALHDAVTVHFDHYERLTEKPVRRLREWIERGADFSEFQVPGLAEDLKELKQGRSIVDPKTKNRISARKYALVEMPLGRQQRDAAPFIDLLVWVELPLDTALARKLREFTGTFLRRPGSGDPVKFVRWLNAYLDNYLEAVGAVLRLQKEKISAGADIVVDGTREPAAVVRQALEQILAKTEAL